MSDGVCEIDFHGGTEMWCFMERKRDGRVRDCDKIYVSYLINNSNKLI